MDTRTTEAADTAHDILRYRHRPLNEIFAPHTIAVIGATERGGSVGRTILSNLLRESFGGTIFPVNSHREKILGLQSYRHVSDAPAQVDLAIIATPASTVPSLIAECVDAGVKGAIIVSAGFAECGAEGAALAQQILATAQRGNIRLIGPNCIGIMRPHFGLNATFAGVMARPGSIGFISQSGALGAAILDWSFRTDVGFSAFVSIGEMLDVGWSDLIYFLGDDPHTKSILIYMETIGDAAAFLSAAREVALTKPIIVLKAGRTEPAAKAVASHTGALAGSDEVFEAAFQRSGVLCVDSLADLFYMAEALAKQPRPKGKKLMILTNAGGPGVIAADALLDGGGELAELSDETMARFNKLLPPQWSHSNPIDILSDADSERYAKALEIAGTNPNSDGLLVILTPQAMADPSRTAELVRPHAKTFGYPLLASWMGGTEIAAGEAILNRNDIPAFPFPDVAARVFNYMWRYNANLQSLYETPMLATDGDEGRPDRQRAEQMIQSLHRKGRTILNEFESKALLEAYGIPVVKMHIAIDEAQAVKIAEKIGYPVVLKLFSETITHKTEVGGVRLNLHDAESVRRAFRAIAASIRQQGRPQDFMGVTVQPMIAADEGYSIILGSAVDPQFGPVLLFGSGGQLVEVFKDRSLALPPLNTTLARRMMEETRIYRALQGVRGRKPVNLAALEQLVVRFSQLVVEQRWIKEIEINPLLVSSEQLIALDAAAVLHGPELSQEALPKLAIRPYPRQYVRPWKMKDGIEATIRPIRPEDEPLMVKFHETLSDRSVYYRYFHYMKLSQRIAHERLTRICFIDYDREMALVVDHKNSKTGEREILGVGRLIKQHGRNEAEFAVIISDQWHGRGLGSELLRRLFQIGRDEKLTRITADVLPDNFDMLRVCEKLGFQLEFDRDERVMKARIDL